MTRKTLRVAMGVASIVLELACGSSQGTERVFDGRTVSGAYIEPETYAAYTEGAYLEAHEQWAAAERAYQVALKDDPDSPGIWTRLGVIACRTNLKRALDAFRIATERGSHAPAWTAQARCLLDHRSSEQALDSAKRAIALDPTSAEANLLIAEIYRVTDAHSSRHWLFAWLLLDPNALAHWKAIDQQAAVLADPPLSRLLRAELERQTRLGSELGAAALASLSRPNPEPGAFPELESAILRGDLAAAQLSSSAAGLSELDLAWLALRLGQPSLASHQADLVLGASPENGDAWVVALLAATLASDPARLESLLRPRQGPRLPTRVMAQHVTTLLRWWIDDDAANEWAAAYRVRAKAALPPPVAPR